MGGRWASSRRWLAWGTGGLQEPGDCRACLPCARKEREQCHEYGQHLLQVQISRCLLFGAVLDPCMPPCMPPASTTNASAHFCPPPCVLAGGITKRHLQRLTTMVLYAQFM